MPSLLKVKIERARDLPVMDKNLQGDASTDAYVVMSLDSKSQRTRTCRKSLNPAFNEEFRFEIVDDSILQDVPLELKVIDQDLYSSELIGVVYIDLTPLIMRTAHSNDKDLVIQGWFPLFDTTKGIRGYLSVVIKLQFIGNDNPFRDSSAGVQFFSSSSLSPRAFVIQEVLGLVVDLVVDDDLESSWQDYFRKANKSTNDSRLKVLYNLSAEVRREIGKKVLELGGNAVLGYLSHFDMIGGSSGLVVRAYGTACRLLKVGDSPSSMLLSPGAHSSTALYPFFNSLGGSGWGTVLGYGGAIAAAMMPSVETTDSMFSQLSRIPGKSSSEQLFLLKAITATTGNAVPLIAFGPATDKRDVIVAGGAAPLRGAEFGSGENTNVFQTEVWLLSLKSFGVHVRIRLGGLVMARSVKFLGKLEATLSDQETREGWWEELRDEIKNHARTVCCTHIIGYTETCTIYGDVCVLSAVGTAAVVKYLGYPTAVMNSPLENRRTSPIHRRASRNDPDDEGSADLTHNRYEYDYDDEEEEEEEEELEPDEFGSGMKISRRSIPSSRGHPGVRSAKGGFGGSKSPQIGSEKSSSKSMGGPQGPSDGSAMQYPYSKGSQERPRRVQRPCSYVHVPYNHNNAPFSFMRLVPCIACRRKWVPETILATVEPSPALAIRGVGQLLEARVCRIRKAASGETDAVKISELLPFVEFDVQKQLMLKLKVAGMNACFGYSCKIQIGSDMVIAMATCTAVYLEALPPSPTLHFLKAQQQGRGAVGEQDGRLIKMQKDLETMFQTNRDAIEAAASAAAATDAAEDEAEEQEARQSGVTYEVSRTRRSVGSRGTPTSGTALDTLQEEEDPSDIESRRSSSSSSSSSSSEGDDDSSLESPPSSSSSSTSSSSSSSTSDSDPDSPKEAEARQSRRGSDLSAESRDDDVEKSKEESSHRRSVRFTADTAENLSSKSIGDEGGFGPQSPDPVMSRKSGKESQKEKKDKDERHREKARVKERLRELARRPIRARRKVYKDDRPPVVVEIEDETDADMIAVLHDWSIPIGINMVNIGFVPGSGVQPTGEGRTVSVLLRKKMSQASKQYRLRASESNRGGAPLPSLNLGGILTLLFNEAYLKMCISIRQMMPCHILGLTHCVNILEEDTVEIMISAIAHEFRSIPRNNLQRRRMFRLKEKLPVSDASRTFGRPFSKEKEEGLDLITSIDSTKSNVSTEEKPRPKAAQSKGEGKGEGEGEVEVVKEREREKEKEEVKVLAEESGRGHRSLSFDSSPTHHDKTRKNTSERKRAASLNSNSPSDSSRPINFLIPPEGSPLVTVTEGIDMPLSIPSQCQTQGEISRDGSMGNLAAGSAGVNAADFFMKADRCRQSSLDSNSWSPNISSRAGSIDMESGKESQKSVETGAVDHDVGASAAAALTSEEREREREGGARGISMSSSSRSPATRSPSPPSLLARAGKGLSTSPKLGTPPLPLPPPLSLQTGDAASLYSTTPLFMSPIKMKIPRSPRSRMTPPSSPAVGSSVHLTPLDSIPGGRIERYLGPVQLHFIKDSWSVRGEGTMESFYYLFVSEVNACARAQVAALGGNALLCHRVGPQESGGRAFRNQTYIMISVAGDAVLVDYDSSDNNHVTSSMQQAGEG